jgi:hypothetical protein
MGDQTTSPRLEDFRFGAIALWGGLVEAEALEASLAAQRGLRREPGATPRIGELLVRDGALSESEVRRVLRVQLQRMPAEGHLLFGRIAVAHRFASEDAVRRALDEQSREMLAGRSPKMLGETMLAAGALSEEEIAAILAYQSRRDAVPMSKVRRRGTGDAAASPSPGADRPAWLPGGVAGFLLDHSIWIALGGAAVAALVLAGLRDFIFG